MTSPEHASGTDRVLEAAETLSVPEDAVVVNIQGDEPLLDPEMLTALIEPFADPDILVTTLASKIGREEAGSPDRVKVAWTRKGFALYFSRALIPHTRNEEDGSYWGHIGLYGFRMPVLRLFKSLGQSELEKRERLEQLRLLENDVAIYVVPAEGRTLGVDRPEDVEKVVAKLSEKK
jgi:3-deoxy-manno-octulosonate cytidylyltransferase (CMP-KDO synthetase)